MKFKPAAIIIAAALSSFAVYAADDTTTGTDVGLITFDGAVTDTTCQITTNNGVDANNVTITLPVVKKSDVEATTIDTGVGSKEFELHLSGCPDAITSASAVFTSTQFAELSNGTLKADPSVAGAATNVSLALYNNTSSDSSQIKVGLPDNNTQVVTIADGAADLAYRVAYVPSYDWNATSNPVTSGKVSSNATFTISYE
ncbi:fimbrial protein [unidentified bacterial endosymbiont]|jgi:major type 1 subunit fimbrin (pilin)|uniref:fimbrial protein n=1 Tax=unidentified bacterial endosymbiont TaxID=2355 RepID=UPI00209E6220|nr:fimbrial protein [unidentified bacterial endosymbiont]